MEGVLLVALAEPNRNTVKLAGESLEVSVLFLGPFELDSVVERSAAEWTRKIGKATGRKVKLTVGDPPYADDSDLECKGYWLRVLARRPEEQTRLMRNQCLAGLVLLLTLRLT